MNKKSITLNKLCIIVITLVVTLLCIIYMANNLKENKISKTHEINKQDNEYLIVGYWENYVDKNPIKLSEISDLYDIINITFARNSELNDGTVTFELNEYLCKNISYSKKEFIEDIKRLQNKGKKVLVAIGGEQGGSFKITNDHEVNNFVRSLTNIVDEYNFDGIDIDIETGNLEIEYMEKATKIFWKKYNGEKMITLNSSLTDMKSADVNEGKDNFWYKFAVDMKDKLAIVSSRYYNSGTQSGYDYKTIYSREQGHEAFIASIVAKQLENKNLANNNIGITILGMTEEVKGLPQAYMEPNKIINTLKVIIEGKNLDLDYRNFIPVRAYPELKAVSIWSINGDALNNYQMANSISTYLKMK